MDKLFIKGRCKNHMKKYWSFIIACLFCLTTSAMAAEPAKTEPAKVPTKVEKKDTKKKADKKATKAQKKDKKQVHKPEASKEAQKK